MVGGHGTLGLHEVRPVTVHFTGAHTAYGPIRASQDAGVWYFTLRNGFDPGARFMTHAGEPHRAPYHPGSATSGVRRRPAPGPQRSDRDPAWP